MRYWLLLEENVFTLLKLTCGGYIVLCQMLTKESVNNQVKEL